MRYILRLYVMGTTQLSQRAIENTRKICEDELKGKYKLEIIDLKKNIQLAEDERIFATPTLEKKLPLPLKRIVGDFNNKEKVLVGLDIINAD